MAAAADTAASAEPLPDTCEHPAPVRGIMAQEFAHYDGALGPEGKRRTVTFYGPVIGGLPIIAWHCEQCGLLRLEYPDGRKEERHLFPGPQPGLIQRPTDDDPIVDTHGTQARVSGLSLSSDLFGELEAERPAAPRSGWLWRVFASTQHMGRQFYVLNGWSQAAVVFLVAALIGLGVVGVLAVYTYSTPAAISIVITATIGCFVAGFIALIVGAAVRTPALSPAPADAADAKPPMGSTLKTSVGLMSASLITATISALLAVYDYGTSPVEGWWIIATMFLFTSGFSLATVHGLTGMIPARLVGLRQGAVTTAVCGFLAMWSAAVLDYTGVRPEIWVTTLDAWIAIAAAFLLVASALQYAVASIVTPNNHK